MTWKKLAKLSDLPEGGLTRVSAGEFDVLVVRGENGCVVVPPSCPHMRTDLGEAFFDGCILTCSKHLWQWSVPDGGTAMGEAERDLLVYESREEDGCLYAELSEELIYTYDDDSGD